MAEAVEVSRRAFIRNQGRTSRRALGRQVGHKSTGFRPDPETYRLMLAGAGLNQRAGESRRRADNRSCRGIRSGAASSSSGRGSEDGSHSGSWETTNSGSSSRARAVEGWLALGSVDGADSRRRRSPLRELGPGSRRRSSPVV